MSERQYYCAEMTRNPIWLLQERDRKEQWRTVSVFSSREKAEEYGEANSHNFGTKWVNWRVYAVCCYDDALAQAIAAIRPDLVDDWSVGGPTKEGVGA